VRTITWSREQRTMNEAADIHCGRLYQKRLMQMREDYSSESLLTITVLTKQARAAYGTIATKPSFGHWSITSAYIS
jgi:hypothetical protein